MTDIRQEIANALAKRIITDSRLPPDCLVMTEPLSIPGPAHIIISRAGEIIAEGSMMYDGLKLRVIWDD